MNVEELREYCLSKKGVTDDFPFDETVLVMRVGNKMFALIHLHKHPAVIAVKCNPEYAIELRERYSAVTPALHFNKKHWNDITMDGSISETDVKVWIDQSYELVLEGMSKAQRMIILDR